jgi:hypothetical protein
MKTITLSLFLTLSVIFNIQGQISTTNTKISKDDIIIKTVKVYDCISTVPEGSTLKTETVKKGKDKTYTITTEKKITSPEDIFVEKEIKIRMTGFDGIASIYTVEEKPGRVFVDYWLNPKFDIPAKTKIKEISRKLKCPKDLDDIKWSDYEPTEKVITTKEKKTYYLQKIELSSYRLWLKPDSTTVVPDWFTHTDRIIEIYNDSDKVVSVLVDKYDRDVVYELELKNRQVVTVINKSVNLGPLTLPFKYRFGYSEDGIDVNQEFKADINIGAFAGFKIANLTIRKEQEKNFTLPENSLNFGPFLSLAAVELDKTNTTTGEIPLLDEEKASIGTLSFGLGLIFNLNNLNIGVFGGIESGFGSQAKNWNFNNKPWLGIGLGYDLNNFKKKD